MKTPTPIDAARALAGPLSVGIAIGAGVLSPAPADAAEVQPRSGRLVSREAGAFLDLTAAQRQALEALQQQHAQRLQTLRASAARSDKAPAAPAAELCQQAEASRTAWLNNSRALLTPPQLARLAQLEEAFRLMPIIESAQAAGLLDDRLSLPPRGMPDGYVAVAHSWARVPAAPALPGCPAQTLVTPELERTPPGASASGPAR